MCSPVHSGAPTLGAEHVSECAFPLRRACGKAKSQVNGEVWPSWMKRSAK